MKRRLFTFALAALTIGLLGSCSKINERIDGLDKRVYDLEAGGSALEQMIQGVSITPAYSDGSVESTKDGVLHLDIIVTPAEAVATLTKGSLKVLVNEVKTKAVDVDTVAVTKFKVDAAKGTITARADISSVLPVASSGKALTIAVNVKNGISDFITEFYPVTLSTESNVTITDETEATKVSIKADEDFPESVMGNIGVAEGFKDTKPTSVSIPMPSLKVGGIGTVTFNEKATAKIKANAEGSTNVFFKVEDVTTTKPVKNADVVLEVTMKTVDENGKEVFNEKNAEGEVTIQIPMDENVAYVNSVTLVNDAGEPIEGGVVPGSEEIENGILTFKVNHFSKYAVDYVTKAEFVSVTGVSVEPASVTLQVGDTLRLAAIITPDNATNKKVTWSSSDTTKVKVDDTGKITAVAFGEATITVTTKDGGKTATCTVKVSETNTMAEILKTISGIPEVDDTTPPSNAWVNSTNPDCKAFVGKVDGDKCFILKAGAENFGVLMDDTFEKVDDNTFRRVESGIGTLTVKMEEGKFSSLEFQAESGSKFEVFNGTYAPESFIDLGVTDAAGKPVYWAKCNVGAISPQDYGDCFAWGETAPYYEGTGGWPSTPTWKTGKTAGYDWLSYCGSSEFVEWSTPPYDATTKILKPAFDAATTVNSGWRTPTSAELVALASSCVCIWTTDYNGTGVAGYLVYKAKDEADKGLIYSENHAWHIWKGSGYTAGPDAVETYSPSDVHMFLPAAGYGYRTDHCTDMTVYMSSTLCTEYEEGHAYTLYFSKFDMGPRNTFDFPARFIGCFIRPVKN